MDTGPTNWSRREHELHDRRSGRNFGVLIILGALVALIFAVTIVKDPLQVRNPSTNSGCWSCAISDTVKGWFE